MIYIDDEGMMMEDGGEMDLLYREEGERTRETSRQRSAGNRRFTVRINR